MNTPAAQSGDTTREKFGRDWSLRENRDTKEVDTRKVLDSNPGMVTFLGVCLLLAQAGLSLDQLRWIAGEWQGTAGKAEIEEHWTAIKGGAMLGVSRTVAGGHMVMFEFLRIEQRSDGTHYVAQPRGRPPVDFRLTRGSDREAVFENPDHDKPKIITYRLGEDGSLVARVEGDEKRKHIAHEFRFRRVR